MIFQGKPYNLEALDFDWTAFQGFLHLSKTLRDLRSSDHIFYGKHSLIRRKNIGVRGFLSRLFAGGGPRLSNSRAAVGQFIVSEVKRAEEELRYIITAIPQFISGEFQLGILTSMKTSTF